MNNVNNTILQPITELSLSSSDFGNDLNDRLENINDNFLKIVQTDFLKGNPGNSAGVKSCLITNNGDQKLGLYKSVNDQNELTSNDLYKLLKKCIQGTTVDNHISLRNIQITDSNDYYNWHDQLDESEIQLIYETIEDKNVIVSSLPYVFLDNRFKHLDVMESNDGKHIPNIEDLVDQSCVIYYQKTGNDAGFQKVQTFPTIYYDKNIDEGNFCWMINNSRSGIPCKGPKGMDGHDGRIYVGFINPEIIKDETDKNVHELYCIIENGEQKKPRSIQGIEDGSAIICFEAELDNTGKYLPITTTATTSTGDDEESSVVSSYKISTIKVDKNNTNPNLTYTVYGGQNATNVNLLSNLNLFEILLSKIGYDNEGFGNLDGLFIPASENGSRRHILKAIDNDNDDIKETLKLSLDNGSGDTKESNIHIDYNNAVIGRFEEIKMNLAPNNAAAEIPIIEFDAILHPSMVYGYDNSHFNCRINGTDYLCRIKDTINVIDANNEELTTVCNLLNTVVFNETSSEEKLITFFDAYEDFDAKKILATYMLKWANTSHICEFLNKLYQGEYKYQEENNTQILTDLSGWGVKILKLMSDISIVEGEYVLKIDVEPNWSESSSDITGMWGASNVMTDKSNVKYSIDPSDYLNDVSIDESQASGKIWKYSNNGGLPIYSLADPQSINENWKSMCQLPIYFSTDETETNIGFPSADEGGPNKYRNTILLNNVKANGGVFITAENKKYFEEHRNNSEIKQFLVLTKDEYEKQIQLLKDITQTQKKCETNINTNVNINGELNCRTINGIQNLELVINDLKNRIKELEDKIKEMS